MKMKNTLITFSMIPQTYNSAIDNEIGSENKNNYLKLQDQQINAFAVRLNTYNHFLDTVNKSDSTSISDLASQLANQVDILRKLSMKDNQQSQLDQNLQINDYSNMSISMSHSLNNVHDQTSVNLFSLRIQNQRLKYRQKLLQQKLEYHKILKYRALSTSQSYGLNKASSHQKEQLLMKIKQRQLMKQEVTILESIVNKQSKIHTLQKKWKLIDDINSQVQKISKDSFDVVQNTPKLTYSDMDSIQSAYSMQVRDGQIINLQKLTKLKEKLQQLIIQQIQ